MTPRRSLNCLGMKYTFANLIEAHGLGRWCPPTFTSIAALRKALATKAISPDGRWFVKISNMNGRRGVTCFNTIGEADACCAELEEKSTATYYVVQAEVPSPLLLDSRKVLMRLWGLFTIDHSGEMWLHISKRLRVNTMQDKYGEDDAPSANIEHNTNNFFEDSQDWSLYPSIWPQCCGVAIGVAKAMVASWSARPKTKPPPVMHPSGGYYNFLGFDFIPSTAGGEASPVLLEVNTDPSFRNKCTETAAFAGDVDEFFFTGIPGGKVVLPDLMFKSVPLGHLAN
eukprot:Sspe_Gene.6193::Locus_2080_Transcript_2_2_Confidence_0.667_Length_1226::g.6193::m.6193